MYTLEESIIKAFAHIDKTMSPKWTSGLGNKEALIRAFSQTAIPEYKYLGYATSDGLRHSMGRALPNSGKSPSVLWRSWVLSTIGRFLCPVCGLVFDLEHKSTHKGNSCKTCESNRLNSRRESIQELIITTLNSGKGCVECGITNPIVLEFDHKDPSTKCFNIGDSYSKPLDKVVLELSKCDIVCANCHRIRTSKTFSFYKESIKIGRKEVSE